MIELLTVKSTTMPGCQRCHAKVLPSEHPRLQNPEVHPPQQTIHGVELHGKRCIHFKSRGLLCCFASVCGAFKIFQECLLTQWPLFSPLAHFWIRGRSSCNIDNLPCVGILENKATVTDTMNTVSMNDLIVL